MKKEKMEKEIDKLKDCVKEKDERITEIENRWQGIKKSIYNISLAILLALTTVGFILAYFNDIVLFYNILIAIGAIATVYTLSVVTIIVLFWLVQEELEDGDVCLSFFLGMIPTAIILFLLGLNTFVPVVN